MPSRYSSKNDLYKEFILCVKFKTEGGYYCYREMYDQLKDMGWVQQAELKHINDDIVHRGDNYLGLGKVLTNVESDTIAILEHESGPEIWIIPVATFVASAIASGVIGNAAYALIQKIFSALTQAQNRTRSDIDDNDEDRDYFSRSDHFSISTTLRTSRYETIELNQLPPSQQIELILITIRDRWYQLSDEKEAFHNTTLERRIEYIEDQIKLINLNILHITEELKQEQAVWRRRNTNISERISKLENSRRGSFIRKFLR